MTFWAGSQTTCTLGVLMKILKACGDARNFVGRAPEQVDEFLEETVRPELAKRAETLDSGFTGGRANIVLRLTSDPGSSSSNMGKLAI